MTATAFATRQGGVLVVQQLTRLDRELLAAMIRFGYMRGQQLAAWTGASGWGVQEHTSKLKRSGYAQDLTVSVDMVDQSGRIVPTTCTVWEATSRGADAIGDIVVPGTGGLEVHLPARRPSRADANHVLGAADLACWYRRGGFLVAAEREIRSLEMPRQLPHQRRGGAPVQPERHWCTKPPGVAGVHPPDLGVVDRDGLMWAIELERAVKSVRAYGEVIAAYRADGLGQVWHILGQATSCQRRVGIDPVATGWD